ncbi:MAG: hypothetical protein HY831_00005 [Candidatus Aenigmarchaeota archaeon]|nr:hypothetical protein [Candidatus Aenigmarchaeota archaeon]
MQTAQATAKILDSLSGRYADVSVEITEGNIRYKDAMSRRNNVTLSMEHRADDIPAVYDSFTSAMQRGEPEDVVTATGFLYGRKHTGAIHWPQNIAINEQGLWTPYGVVHDNGLGRYIATAEGKQAGVEIHPVMIVGSGFMKAYTLEDAERFVEFLSQFGEHEVTAEKLMEATGWDRVCSPYNQGLPIAIGSKDESARSLQEIGLDNRQASYVLVRDQGNSGLAGSRRVDNWINYYGPRVVNAYWCPDDWSGFAGVRCFQWVDEQTADKLGKEQFANVLNPIKTYEDGIIVGENNVLADIRSGMPAVDVLKKYPR